MQRRLRRSSVGSLRSAKPVHTDSNLGNGYESHPGERARRRAFRISSTTDPATRLRFMKWPDERLEEGAGTWPFDILTYNDIVENNRVFGSWYLVFGKTRTQSWEASDLVIG